MFAKNVNDNACSLNERGARKFFARKLAPMYGLAPTVNPLLLIDTRLHLCIRPIRGSLNRLLANIA